MRSRDRLGPLGDAGNLVDIQRRCVGEQQGVRLHYGVELGEHLLLDGHLLEDGFDHRVAIGNRRETFNRLKQSQTPLHLGLREAAAPDAGRVVGADPLHTLRQHLGRSIKQLHREAVVGETHGNAAAHGARADDGGRLDLGKLETFRQGRDLGDFTLGKEGVAQRLCLLGVFQFREQFSFRGDALVEGQVHRRLDTKDAMIGGFLLAGLAGNGLAHGFEHVGVGLGFFQPIRPVAQARKRACVGHALGPGDGFGAQILAWDDLVDDAERFRLRGGYVPARKDHLQRPLRPDEPRQPLRAAAARQDADQHLWQSDLGARHGDAVVAGERVLQAAPQRVAVDGGDDRFGAGIEHVRHRALRCRPRLAELANVGAGDEAAAGADHHHGLDGRDPPRPSQAPR